MSTYKMPSTGMVFGRVTTMERAKYPYGTVKYTISDGSTFFGSNLDLKVNEWYFFEVQANAVLQYKYVSHRPLTQTQNESLHQAQSDLALAANEAVRVWRQMEREERALFLQAIGIGTTGTLAATSAVNAIGSFMAEEAVLGAVTGGFSLLFSGAMAAATYLQYEARKEAVLQNARTIEHFHFKRKLLSDKLALHTPMEYRHLVPLNPQVNAIVTRTRLMITNFNLEDLIKAQPEPDYQFNLAAPALA